MLKASVSAPNDLPADQALKIVPNEINVKKCAVFPIKITLIRLTMRAITGIKDNTKKYADLALYAPMWNELKSEHIL